MGLPDRETGGVPGLRGRGGAVPVGTLRPTGFGGGSSAAGRGSGGGARLAGATLPLEEMVAFGLAAAGSAACVLATAAGSTRSAWEPATSAAAAGRALESSAASTAGFAGAAGWADEDPASTFATFAAAAFLISGSEGSGSATSTGGGGGGGGGFKSPSRSALRLTRSA